MNIEQKVFFSEILANPGQLSAAHAPQLSNLVALYPQSGILHALLARSCKLMDVDEFQQKLKSAAVYAPDRTILYHLVNHPEQLTAPGTPDVVKPLIKEPQQPEEVSTYYFHEPQTGEHHEIDDEVFDEITGIDDIQITRPENAGPGNHHLEDLIIAQYGLSDPHHAGGDANAGLPDQADKQAEVQAGYTLSNANFKDRMSASSDDDDDDQEYESDDQETAEEQQPLSTENSAVVYEFANPGQNLTDDDLRVSKYNDDKMPYSFMWWLDKTRKEHATNNQPYAPYKPAVFQENRLIVSEELQQQYYENIFHTTTLEELEKNTVKPEVETKRKEDEIIERFIQEDPQIKSPSNDTLDNENKAKKSAEDEDELVSETLARIYLDQMLYHKAISTYQKLLLKFPEKSSYFVAQIKLLEKKIN